MASCHTNAVSAAVVYMGNGEINVPSAKGVSMAKWHTNAQYVTDANMGSSGKTALSVILAHMGN